MLGFQGGRLADRRRPMTGLLQPRYAVRSGTGEAFEVAASVHLLDLVGTLRPASHSAVSTGEHADQRALRDLIDEPVLARTARCPPTRRDHCDVYRATKPPLSAVSRREQRIPIHPGIGRDDQHIDIRGFYTRLSEVARRPGAEQRDLDDCAGELVDRLPEFLADHLDWAEGP